MVNVGKYFCIEYHRVGELHQLCGEMMVVFNTNLEFFIQARQLILTLSIL